MLSLPAVLTGAWIVGLALLGPLDGSFTVQHLAYRVLPAACGLWGAGTILLSVGIVIVAEQRRRASAGRR
jgi:hypothetical protein